MHTQGEFQSHFVATAVWRKLDEQGAKPEPATLGGAKGRRLLMRTDAIVPSGTPVRVDAEGALFLGEVTCSRESGSRCEMVVDVEQVAPGMPDLVNLMKAVGCAPRLDPRKPAKAETAPVVKVRRRKEAPSR